MIRFSFKATRIKATVEICRDAKPGLGLYGASIVEDFLVRVQWFASPVSGDFRKQAMLDGIPLGSSRRIMCHSYGQGEGVGQLPLNFRFPSLTGQSLPALEYLGFELCDDLCLFIALSDSWEQVHGERNDRIGRKCMTWKRATKISEASSWEF